MNVNDRIAKLIQVLGDTENSFAKRIEVSASVVFNVANPKGRQSYPSGPVLEKILCIEQDGSRVSAEWLLRGEGDMFLKDSVLPVPDITEMEKTIELLRKTLTKLEEEFQQLKRKNYDESN